MSYEVKITVLKRTHNKELFGDNPPVPFDEPPQCDWFETGQEFIVNKMGECPPGFCPWAFADIQRDIVHLIFGGSYPWIVEEGVALTNCTDGVRPVIFKLERIED